MICYNQFVVYNHWIGLKEDFQERPIFNVKKTSLNQSNDTKFNGQLVVYDKQNGAENGAS